MNKETFKKLIPLRTDVYAKQLPNGAYTPIYQEITDGVIEKHLSGEETVGFYQLKEDKIKWAVLDIDLSKEVWAKDDFDLADWEQELMKQVDYAQDILSSNNIPSYLEHSGHKGYHLWIFFEYPVKAEKIREGMHRMFDNMKKADPHIFWEVFPKQDAVADTNLGSLVKGPSGFHHKSKQFSKFITPIDIKDVKYATEYNFIDQSALYSVVSKCRALKNLWHDSLAARDCSHRDRVILATMFLNMGPDGREFFEKEFLSKMKNYDPQLTKQQLDQMENKMQPGSEDSGYKPFTCSLLQQENVCKAQCEEIGTRKSPIAFYYWSKGQDYKDPDSEGILDGNSISDKYMYKPDGIYVKEGKEGWKLRSSVKMDIKKEIYVDAGFSGEELDKELEGDLVLPGQRIPFNVTTDVLVEPKKFREFLLNKLPIGDLILPKDTDVILFPAYMHSKPERVIKHKMIGYRKEKGDTYPNKYVMPSVIIDKSGIHENTDILIDLEGDEIPSQLDFKILDDDEYQELLEHMRLDLFPITGKGNYVGYMSFVFAMLPLYEPFIMGDKNSTKFALWLRGETGSGKSYLLDLMYHFYGQMTHVPTWTSTANALSRIGHFHKDTMMLVDDFKRISIASKYEYKRIQGMIQNYSDNTTRQRMNSNTTMQRQYAINGWLVSTGEDLVMGESSNLARIFPIDVDKVERDLVKGDICQQNKQNYRGVPPRIIYHLLNSNTQTLENNYKQNYEDIHKPIKNRSNAARIAKSAALLLTVAEDVFEFLYGKRFVNTEIPYIKEELMKSLDLHLEGAENELAFEQIMTALTELISTNKVWIQAGPQSTNLSLTSNRGDLVGFYDTVPEDSSGKKYPHIVIGRAYDVVQNMTKETIEHSKSGIVQQLYDNKWSLDRSTKRVKLNGHSVSVVRLYPEKFNPDPNIPEMEEEEKEG